MFEVLPAKTIVRIGDIIGVYVEESVMLVAHCEEKKIVYDVCALVKNSKSRMIDIVNVAVYFESEGDARGFAKDFLAKHVLLDELTYFPNGNAINKKYITSMHSAEHKGEFCIRADVGEYGVDIARGATADYDKTLEEICTLLNRKEEYRV